MPTAREKTCPFERGGRGGLWSAEAELPPDAEADASALQTCPRAAPLAHAVGEGLGVRAKQGASPCVPTPLLVRVHRFGTESLRQGRFSPRGRERAGAPCCPHPPAPSPARRERGNALQGATPCAPTPLSHAVGEGLGVRAKKRARLAHSELKRCTLIIPIAEPEFTKNRS